MKKFAHVFCVAAIVALFLPLAVADEDFTVLSNKRWATYLPQWSALQMHDDELRFESGALIVSRRAQPAKAEYNYKWAWEDQNAGKDLADRTVFTVHATEDINEKTESPSEGIRCSIDAGTGECVIEAVRKGKATVLAKAKAKGTEDFGITPVDWHAVRIVDDGAQIQVYFDGEKDPAVDARYDAKEFAQTRVAFANRRKEGETKMASYIREFKVKDLDEEVTNTEGGRAVAASPFHCPGKRRSPMGSWEARMEQDVLVVKVPSGGVWRAAYETVDQDILQWVGQLPEARHILLNMNAVIDLDDTYDLWAIVLLWRRAQRTRGKLVVCGYRKSVHRQLRETKLRHVLQFCHSCAEAIRSLR